MVNQLGNYCVIKLCVFYAYGLSHAYTHTSRQFIIYQARDRNGQIIILHILPFEFYTCLCTVVYKSRWSPVLSCHHLTISRCIQFITGSIIYTFLLVLSTSMILFCCFENQSKEAEAIFRLQHILYSRKQQNNVSTTNTNGLNIIFLY